MRDLLRIGVLALAIALAGCDDGDQAAAPPPVELTAVTDATGYYCNMLLSEHDGPKGQIHLLSQKEPVWFSSVRDTVAFTRLKEEPKDVTAIYVSDMGKAKNWAQPEPGSWIEARQAWFVLDSRATGGMGLPEAVPFGTAASAEAFVVENGGRVVRFDEIPTDYVLGMPDMSHGEATQ